MTQTTTGTVGSSALKWMFCGLAIVLAVWYGRAQYTEAKEKAEAQKAKAVQQAVEYAKTHPPQQGVVVRIPPEDPEYPHSGEGYATRVIGLKVWLDPGKSHTRSSGPARYVVENHRTMYYIDRMDGRDTGFRSFPAGRYLVYPVGDGEVFFRWWTD